MKDFAWPVEIDESDEGLVVTFPDFPEAVTQGDSMEEALEMAQDALETVVSCRVVHGTACAGGRSIQPSWS